MHPEAARLRQRCQPLDRIEDAEGVEQVEAIAAVPGIDALFVGPGDLSASLGVVGQFDHPRVLDATERVARAARDAGIAFERGLDLPAFGIAPDAELVRWAQEVARTTHLGTGAVSFATESSVFQKAGILTVVLGPGSIEQAHKPDEYIS